MGVLCLRWGFDPLLLHLSAKVPCTHVKTSMKAEYVGPTSKKILI
jgi:hypothetical protein